MSRLRVLPLGGCSLTIPLLRLQRKKMLVSVLTEIGFPRWFLAMSPGLAWQLVNIARWTTRLPPGLDIFCYHDNAVPERIADNSEEILRSTDITLLEMTTPVEFRLGDFILSQNQVRKLVKEWFASQGRPEAAQTALQWTNALQKTNHDLAASYSEQLIASMNSGEDNPLIRQIVLETRSRHLQEEEIYGYLSAIQAFMQRPIGLVLYNFRFMPDGRPVDWPPGFKDQMLAVAARLGLPTYDPVELVQTHGVATAMIENSGHYAMPFYDIVAEEYVRFIGGILGREIQMTPAAAVGKGPGNMNRLRVLPLGGCSLTIPLMQLQRRKMLVSVLTEVGFPRWLLTLSPGAAWQLVNIARGLTRPPAGLDAYCYHDSAVPGRIAHNSEDILRSTDITLLEMTTPVEFRLGEFILNQNRVRKLVKEWFARQGPEAAQTAAQWTSALQKTNNDLAASYSEQLIASMNSGEDNPLIRQIVLETRSRHLQEEEIYGYLSAIQAFMQRPIGLVLYNFRFMPDGRPVDWPPGFKDQMLAVAGRLGLPTYDPADLVQAHGVATAMIEDSGHYAVPFYDIVAEEYVRFVSGILGREIKMS